MINRLAHWIFLFVCFINILPLVIIVFNSFTENGELTLKWYKLFLKDYMFMLAILNSIKIAFFSSFLALIVAICTVIVIYYFNKTEKFFHFTSIILMTVPDIIIGLAFLLLFDMFTLYRGFFTVVISHAALSSAYVTYLLIDQLRSIDRSIEEAAADLCISPYRMFLYVILPIMQRSLIINWFFAFALSLEDIVVVSFTSGPGSYTFPLIIYSKMRHGLSGEVDAAVVVFTILICIFILMMREFIQKK